MFGFVHTNRYSDDHLAEILGKIASKHAAEHHLQKNREQRKAGLSFFKYHVHTREMALQAHISFNKRSTPQMLKFPSKFILEIERTTEHCKFRVTNNRVCKAGIAGPLNSLALRKVSVNYGARADPAAACQGVMGCQKTGSEVWPFPPYLVQGHRAGGSGSGGSWGQS